MQLDTMLQLTQTPTLLVQNKFSSKNAGLDQTLLVAVTLHLLVVEPMLAGVEVACKAVVVAKVVGSLKTPVGATFNSAGERVAM